MFDLVNRALTVTLFGQAFSPFSGRSSGHMDGEVDFLRWSMRGHGVQVSKGSLILGGFEASAIGVLDAN